MFSIVIILVFLAVKDVILNSEPPEEKLKDINLFKDDELKLFQDHNDRYNYSCKQNQSNNISLHLSIPPTDDFVRSNDDPDNWINKADARIIRGYEIDITEQPSYISIFINNTYMCAGNIITDRHVLTAAHCVTINDLTPEGYFVWQLIDPTYYSFRIGSSYINNEGDINYPSSFHVHPEYLSDSEEINYRDVAVIVLRDTVMFSERAQPAFFHPYIGDTSDELVYQMTMCSVAGWGITGKKTIDKNPNRRLMEVQLNLISIAECNLKYEYLNEGLKVDPTVHVCTYTKGKDACQGDSGGGLICPDGLLAITSWGYGCAKLPGVFARVDNCMDFINSVLEYSDEYSNGSSAASLDIILVLFIIPKYLLSIYYANSLAHFSVDHLDR